MRKNIISALALMLGVFGFSGCVKNADETINSEIQEFTLISHAYAPNTRMNISGDKTTGFSTNWEDGDQIGVYAVSENAEHSLYTCNYYHSATVDSDGLAKFTGTIRSTGGDDFSLYAYYPYTAGSTHTDLDDQKGVDCKISSVQTMSGASFDKSCAYMVAKTGLTVNTASQNSSYEVGNWQFRHTVAFINLSTKAISAEGVSGDEIVSSVKFEAVGISENPTLAGDFQFNLEDGAMTFTNSENVVTVNVPAETELSALSAWIVTNPFEMTVDDELEIIITTDAHSILKRVSIAKNFEAANVYTLNLTINSDCVISEIEKPKDAVYELVTDASTLAAGDKVIIAAKPNALFTGDYAMGTNQKRSNRAAEEVVIANNTITNPSSNVQIFELKTGTISNTFAFYAENGNNIGYISAGSTKGSNSLTTITSITDNSCWSISIDESFVATIVANGEGDRHTLQFNNAMQSTEKNYLFNCYASATSQKPVQIYRLQDDREPLVKPAITVTPDNTNKSITVSWETVDNATSYVVSCTGQTEQTLGADATECTFSGLEYGKYTVTVTASADGYRSSSASEEGVEIIDYNLAMPKFTSVTGTTEKITATWAAVQHAKSYIYKLNKLKDNVETTVIDETPYGPTDSKAETVTLTIEGSFTAGEQYVLYVKSAAEAPFIESAPAKSEAFEITAAGAEPELIIYSIDFENTADTYTDWTFNNFMSQQSRTISSHGGTYYGTTGGKTTGYLQFNSVMAKPKSLTFFISKQSNNTTSSTWIIQQSTDGSNWTDLKSQSATSMTKGTWNEISIDLSGYNDIYIRIYYTGSTAVRNIDDVTLVIEK